MNSTWYKSIGRNCQKRMNEWMKGWLKGWLNEWLNEWRDGGMKGGGVCDKAAHDLLRISCYTWLTAHIDAYFLLSLLVGLSFSLPVHLTLWSLSVFLSHCLHYSHSIFISLSHSIFLSLSHSIFLSTFIDPSCSYISNYYYTEILFLLSVTYFLVQIISKCFYSVFIFVILQLR